MVDSAGLLMPLAMASNGSGGGSMGSLLLMMGIIFAIFYGLVIWPEQKKRQEHEDMVENLQSGDRVVTMGGIHGQVTSISDDTVKINVAKDFNLTVSREKIAALKTKENTES